MNFQLASMKTSVPASFSATFPFYPAPTPCWMQKKSAKMYCTYVSSVVFWRNFQNQRLPSKQLLETHAGGCLKARASTLKRVSPRLFRSSKCFHRSKHKLYILFFLFFLFCLLQSRHSLGKNDLILKSLKTNVHLVAQSLYTVAKKIGGKITQCAARKMYSLT
jgi:hypothetical protein